MQCAKPLLATRFSSITRSVIVDKSLGYTFSPNVEALVAALETVVSDGKEVLHTKGAACKEYAASLFTATKMGSAAQVDGVLWDMTRALEIDCKLQIHKFDSDKGHNTFWHSSAHILGQSIEMTYSCKLCIGPCTTRGEGFYYDAFYHGLTLTEKDDFGKIQAQGNKAVKDKQPFERVEVTRPQALEFFSDNEFKEHGVACETYKHPVVMTVEEQAKHVGHLDEGLNKNLFLKDKKM